MAKYLSMSTINQKLKNLAIDYSDRLAKKIGVRVKEMEKDDNSHYLMYRVLGVSFEEGQLIDIYQNKGRFFYKYAGSFLEEATILCFEEKFSKAERKVRIPNKTGERPKTFEIDCLVEDKAYEIKWRDATTDGDHITKEHTRVQNIRSAGFVPIRIMFYYPNRQQAIRIQETLQTVYAGVDGQYYYGDSAWNFVQEETDINLKEILEEIAENNTKSNS